LRVVAEQQEFFLMNQVLRLGRLTAYERMCHLLLELHERLAWVGLATDGAFVLIPKQEVIADAIGLSVVHVSRMLSQLRQDRLLDLTNGVATLVDPPRMAAICDYLSLEPPA